MLTWYTKYSVVSIKVKKQVFLLIVLHKKYKELLNGFENRKGKCKSNVIFEINVFCLEKAFYLPVFGYSGIRR